VEPTRLQKDRKANEQLAEKHISRSWQKELEGVETYFQRQEKMEGTRRQPLFLMEGRTVLLLLLYEQIVYENVIYENRIFLMFWVFRSVCILYLTHIYVNWFCYVFEYILQSQKLFITLHTNLRVKI
jgi:hypothetical protein